MSSSTRSTPPPADPLRAAEPRASAASAGDHGPVRPVPDRPRRPRHPGRWLAPGSELDPQIFARASRLRAVSMDMTGGYAKRSASTRRRR